MLRNDEAKHLRARIIRAIRVNDNELTWGQLRERFPRAGESTIANAVEEAGVTLPASEYLSIEDMRPHRRKRNAFKEEATRQMNVAKMERAEKKAAGEAFDLWEMLR